MQNLADLASVLINVTGDAPPALVGPAMTASSSKIFVCGGRVAQSRKLIMDVWELDLKIHRWRKLGDGRNTDGEYSAAPAARYFHTVDVWKNYLVIFGGMGAKQRTGPILEDSEITVLDDLAFFNLLTETWSRFRLPVPQFHNMSGHGHIDSIAEVAEQEDQPEARYAHLSTVVGETLIILGGQDASHAYIPDLSFYNLQESHWRPSQTFDAECGSYRSILISQDSSLQPHPAVPYRHPGSKRPSMTQRRSSTEGEMYHDHGNGINGNEPRSTNTIATAYLFSNHNFNEVQRGLLELSLKNDFGPVSIKDLASRIDQTVLPMGLRFPSGSHLGHHLLISGTYISTTRHEFAIWTLDLKKWTWTRIETGNSLLRGSWNKAILSRGKSSLYIFGNRNGSLIQDYNQRQINFDHVVVLDLETYGIYDYPKPMNTLQERQAALSLMTNRSAADLNVVCIDGQRLSVNSRVLKTRWEWFKSLCEGTNPDDDADLDYPDQSASPSHTTDLDNSQGSHVPSKSLLYFPERYQVAIAFFQYLYTSSLWTPEQLQPSILASLLILSHTYLDDFSRLRSLVLHALHEMLTTLTADLIYETATLVGANGLQLRSLRMLMSYGPTDSSAIVQKRAWTDVETLAPQPDQVRTMQDEAPLDPATPTSGQTSQSASQVTTPDQSAKDPLASTSPKDSPSKTRSPAMGSPPSTSGPTTKSFMNLTSPWSRSSPSKGDGPPRRMSLFESHLQSTKLKSSSSDGSLASGPDRLNKSMDGSSGGLNSTAQYAALGGSPQRSGWRLRRRSPSPSDPSMAAYNFPGGGTPPNQSLSEHPSELAQNDSVPQSPTSLEPRGRNKGPLNLVSSPLSVGGTRGPVHHTEDTSKSTRLDSPKKGFAGFLGRLQKNSH